MQFIRGLMNAIFNGRRRPDRWLEQHYRVQGNTLALQDAEKRGHVYLGQGLIGRAKWAGGMFHACESRPVRACTCIHCREIDDAVMVRCWWCWCWSGMC
jgi:hypothetical protein